MFIYQLLASNPSVTDPDDTAPPDTPAEAVLSHANSPVPSSPSTLSSPPTSIPTSPVRSNTPEQQPLPSTSATNLEDPEMPSEPGTHL